MGVRMGGEEEAFWGRATKGRDPGIDKAAAASNEVIGVVASELAPAERVMVVLQQAPRWGVGARRAIVVTWERVFIVVWDRHRQYEIAQVADRCDVSAEFVAGEDEERHKVVVVGPWGTTKFSVVSRNAATPILDVLGTPAPSP